MSVVFTVDRHWIFLRERNKDGLRNSTSMSVHSYHDVVQLVDILTTHHHNKAWQRIFKCRKSSSKNCICQCIVFLKIYYMYLRNVTFSFAKFILNHESFIVNIDFYHNICSDYKNSLGNFSIILRPRILPGWRQTRKIYYHVLTLHFALTFIDEVIAPL